MAAISRVGRSQLGACARSELMALTLGKKVHLCVFSRTVAHNTLYFISTDDFSIINSTDVNAILGGSVNLKGCGYDGNSAWLVNTGNVSSGVLARQNVVYEVDAATGTVIQSFDDPNWAAGPSGNLSQAIGLDRDSSKIWTGSSPVSPNTLYGIASFDNAHTPIDYYDNAILGFSGGSAKCVNSFGSMLFMCDTLTPDTLLIRNSNDGSITDAAQPRVGKNIIGITGRFNNLYVAYSDFHILEIDCTSIAGTGFATIVRDSGVISGAATNWIGLGGGFVK